MSVTTFLVKLRLEFISNFRVEPKVLYLPDEVYGRYVSELRDIQRIGDTSPAGFGKAFFHSTEIRPESQWTAEQNELLELSSYKQRYEHLVAACWEKEMRERGQKI